MITASDFPKIVLLAMWLKFTHRAVPVLVREDCGHQPEKPFGGKIWLVMRGLVALTLLCFAKSRLPNGGLFLLSPINP